MPPGGKIENRIVQHGNGKMQRMVGERREGFFLFEPGRDQQFAGGHPQDFVDNGRGITAFGQPEGSGGDIQTGQPHIFLMPGNGQNEVVGLCIEEFILHDHSRGDHADHFPFNQAFGGFGILHLITDGHLEPVFDQAGDVALGCPVGDPAHGHGGIVVFVPGSKGNLQHPGGHLGILEKHLVKITHAVEQQGIGIPLLNGEVLLHHGCRFDRGHQSIVIKQKALGFGDRQAPRSLLGWREVYPQLSPAESQRPNGLSRTH